jgi:hypothetical protein
MFLHAPACIKSWAVNCMLLAHIGTCVCICTSWLASWAERLSAYVARELSIYWHVSRAERVSSFSSLCLELRAYLHVLRVCRLHVPCLLACFESWACIFMCWTCVVCMCLVVGMFRELRVYLHVLSVCRLESWALVCMFQELSVYLHSVSCV